MSIKAKIEKSDFAHYHLFKKQISKSGGINLIAEIKKASPSRGMLRAEFDLMAIARTYIKHQAAAISVLTENKYFLGKPEYVKKVSEECPLPVLAKDFIIQEGQIYEAFYNGASAVLLIVAILNDTVLKYLMDVAGDLGMDCLVEVHDEGELNRAMDLDAQIIGINNRDLRTFKVNMKTCETLIPKVSKNRIIVAESGIATHTDIERLEALGAHAVLIGETFMCEEDIGAKIEKIMRS